MVTFVKGNQLIFLASMFFLFSVLYTMVFYYNQATSTQTNIQGLSDQDPTNTAPAESSWISGITQSIIDGLLEVVSLFSPFILIKGLFFAITPPDIYEFLNLLLLRPIGWVGAFITTEWVIDKIRGVSE